MNLKDAREYLIACIEAMLPAFLWGGPGIGKSDLIHQVADTRGMGLIDLRLSQLSDVDLRGVPNVGSDGRLRWLQAPFLPTVERDGERGILLLDELPQALPSVQNAGYQLVLDRAIGEYKLPSGWVVVAAGNNSGDGGYQQRLASPLANRFAQHIEIEAEIDTWADWAVDNAIDPVVIGLLKFRPELLYQFDRQAKSFPTPRSWAMLSKLAQYLPEHRWLDAARQCIGGAAAVEYYAYKQLMSELPSLAEIIRNPTSSVVPSNPGTLYAVCVGLARQMQASNMSAIISYMDRIAIEYAVLGVKSALKRDNSLASLPEFTRWAVKHQSAFKS